MVGVEEAAAWVALRATPGIGDLNGRQLLDRFGSPRAIRAATPAALTDAGCPPALARALRTRETFAAARIEVERIAAAGARLVALDDAEYPPLLRSLPDAPLYLVARGAPLVPAPAVAIVGARRASAYGRDVARQLAEELAHAGVTIVSGLARGIDGAAHEGALRANGCTVAVLGSGIDVIYPSEHRALAEQLVASGTLLSERPIGSAPLPGNFPARNRILAGMTQGTVVIEAAKRSGSLITARLANEAGREVFAVPGRVDSPLSYGSHLMIRDGATLVRGVEDVLEQIAPALRARAVGDPTVGTSPAPIANASSLASTVLAMLANGPLAIDDLIRQSDRPAPEILAEMLDLELRGAVRKLPGRQVELTDRFAGVGRFQ